MGDPLSVAASIIGIIAAAGKVAETLGPLISSFKDTKNIARTIQTQVKDSRSILQALQKLFDNLELSSRRRRELIQIDQLRATLLDGTLIFSDLEPVVFQLSTANEGLRNRVQWVRKRDQLESFVSRLELFKSSITVMLNILQCESDLDAMTKRQELLDLTSQLLQSNHDLSRRLSLLESRPHDDSNSTLSRTRPRMSLISIRSQIRDFEFERDLKETWVYRKARRSTADVSFRSSTALSHAWSTLSDISLSDISAISVVALPISSNDLSNGYYYPQDPETSFGFDEQAAGVVKEENSWVSRVKSNGWVTVYYFNTLTGTYSLRDPRPPIIDETFTLIPQVTRDGTLVYYNRATEVLTHEIPSYILPTAKQVLEDNATKLLGLVAAEKNAMEGSPLVFRSSHSSPIADKGFTADRFSLESEDSYKPMPPPKETSESAQQEIDAALEGIADIWPKAEEDNQKPATPTELSSTEVSSNTSTDNASTVSIAEESQHLIQRKDKEEGKSPHREEEDAGFWIPQATSDGRLFYLNTLTGVSTQELPLWDPHDDPIRPTPTKERVINSHTSPVEALTKEEISELWIPQATPEGRIYFYNTLLKVYSAWLPDDSNEASPWIPQLQATEDATQFYYNTTTKTRVTELPLDLDNDERDRLTRSALWLFRIAAAAGKEPSSAEPLPSPPSGYQESTISKVPNPEVRGDYTALDLKSTQGRTGGGSRFPREYKLVVMGGGGVDKSAIAIRFIQPSFVDEYDPTIEDSYRKQCFIDDEVAVLDVLDTAGQEQFPTITEHYMRIGEGFMIVYSITSRVSFIEAVTFCRQLLRVKDSGFFPMILVGNHCEREDEREVSIKEGRVLAQMYGCSFMEVSVKKRINIDEAFHELVREVRRHRRLKAVEHTTLVTTATTEMKLFKRKQPRKWLKRTTRRRSSMEAIEEGQHITTPTTQRTPALSTSLSRESQNSRESSSSKGHNIQTISSPIPTEHSLGWI